MFGDLEFLNLWNLNIDLRSAQHQNVREYPAVQKPDAIACNLERIDTERGTKQFTVKPLHSYESEDLILALSSRGIIASYSLSF